ncbi:MAG: FAD binding domain-containing protein [Armatimonadetes bacterium]|nr:FAD binding domain-containing protein [Armatimonadota bacterium]
MSARTCASPRSACIRGTASPAADTPPALLALGAVVEVLGSLGPRAVPVAEFFAGPGQHNLQPGEVITGVKVPAPAARSGSAYLKLGTRKAMDIAFVGVAAYLALEDDGTVAEARVGLGAVAPTPRLAAGMTEVLSGRPLDDEAIELAARTAMESASPITDRRCSAEYRRAMTGELTRRALRLAAARAEA